MQDLNQSPRNMYQCQMGKQTMGTPLHSFPRRPDSKLFRLQNPQAPLVQVGRTLTAFWLRAPSVIFMCTHASLCLYLSSAVSIPV
jgi:hypothetical protein